MIDTSYDTNTLRELQRAAVQASKVIVAFNETMFDCARVAYKMHHTRLPGSNRTARLRKKRRTKVINWYRKELE